MIEPTTFVGGCIIAFVILYIAWDNVLVRRK